MLPLLIFLVFSVLRWNPLVRPSQPLVTEVTLQTSITDLQSIQSSLPSPPSLPDSRTLAQTLLFLYLPALILTHCVRLRILIAMTGTFFLTYRAPWAVVLREVLWRSAHLRWTIYYLWFHLSGQAALLNNTPHDDTSPAKPANTLRFLFTIYENQRWWMGLDWTAALLPGERPSWCSAAQHPVSPPTAFSLPKNTVITASDGKGRTFKHTAIWRWEEPEWRVIVRKSDGGLSRVERPLPSTEKDGVNRLLKGKRRDSSGSTSAAGKDVTDSYKDGAEDVDTTGPDNMATDPDGWVYGDNKWENQSNKGGMSKYTRYRRWTRIAIVHELVELSENKTEDSRDESTNSLDSAVIDVNESNGASVVGRQEESNPLRQRLKNTLKKSNANAQNDN
ncbi:hypothetical protein AX15_004663 [Amanita polypyramis BW_CC]|nr:hypothetical protein AX15_004663 [Amanita polypyramis BW_CC]